MIRSIADTSEIDPPEFAAKKRSGALTIDVSERDEWDAGHVDGAIHIPLGDLERRHSEIGSDTSQTVLLYCSHGVRSRYAAATLMARGYGDVCSLRGGLTRWKDEGYSVVGSDPDPIQVQPERSDVTNSQRERSDLTSVQRERYLRHIQLPEFGLEAQRRLLASRVLIIGAGGLGSPAAVYLAAAGVGTLGIVDGDRVELSNLQRQILHSDVEIGRPKTQSAKESLTRLNPDVVVETYELRLTDENVIDVLRDFNLVIDGSDNFATRYIVNDAAVKLGIPAVFASVQNFSGQLFAYLPSVGPCYRCLYPSMPNPAVAKSCSDNGILGVLPGVLGVLQATEAIKILADVGDPLVGRVLLYNALSTAFKELTVGVDPGCAVCAAACDTVCICHR